MVAVFVEVFVDVAVLGVGAGAVLVACW